MIHSTELHLKSVGWMYRGISILKIKIWKQIFWLLHMKYVNRSAFISHSNIFYSISAVTGMNEFFMLQLPSVEGVGLIHWCQAFTNKVFCSLSKFMLFLLFCKFLFIFKNLIATFPVDKSNSCLFWF